MRIKPGLFQPLLGLCVRHLDPFEEMAADGRISLLIEFLVADLRSEIKEEGG